MRIDYRMSKKHTKNTKNTKHTKHTKKSKKNLRKSKSRKMRGGCGCFKGGFGPASFQGLSKEHYYFANDYKDDPNDPHTMTSERLTVGGKSKKNKKSLKKMRGGADLLLGNSLSINPVSSFGTTGGVLPTYNTLNGVQNVNASAYVQHIANKNIAPLV